MTQFDATQPFDIDRAASLSAAQILDAVAEGKTFGDILEVTDEVLEELYAIACEVLDEGDLEGANDAFFFLVAICPYNSELWLRLGSISQQLGSYAEAIQALQMAAILNPTDPFPFIYASQCHQALEDKKAAIDCLELAQVVIHRAQEFSLLGASIIKAKAKLEAEL